ncbi:hypothetical protein SVIO_094860 [Streptomyces violaceusniger]|uniref:Uncharacterized protein n=1 Tax=Streptomyces violaceusniger TaxID=68280 RepID=A0A4D4LLD1_STRVO|nr:hypothetical protein SVIO_094860 [Streptomyces violaceusniger]
MGWLSGEGHGGEHTDDPLRPTAPAGPELIAPWQVSNAYYASAAGRSRPAERNKTALTVGSRWNSGAVPPL